VLAFDALVTMKMRRVAYVTEVNAKDLRKVMKLNRAQSLLKAGRIEESLAEHAAIMAALTSRDAAAAQAAMRAHIESGQEAAA
jgi:DNA-binding FadR family transcriptional regulator